MTLSEDGPYAAWMSAAAAQAPPHAPAGWAKALLRALKVPVTQQNINWLDAWAVTERGNATYNPLNTSLSVKGATLLAGNSSHVKNYPTAAVGIAATAATIKKYPEIMAALHSGNPLRLKPHGASSLVSELRTWGSGNYAKDVASHYIRSIYESEQFQTNAPLTTGQKAEVLGIATAAVGAGVGGAAALDLLTGGAAGAGLAGGAASAASRAASSAGKAAASAAGKDAVGVAAVGALTDYIGGTKFSQKVSYAFTYLGLLLFAIVLGLWGLLKLLGTSPGAVMRDGTKTVAAA